MAILGRLSSKSGSLLLTLLLCCASEHSWRKGTRKTHRSQSICQADLRGHSPSPPGLLFPGSPYPGHQRHHAPGPKSTFLESDCWVLQMHNGLSIRVKALESPLFSQHLTLRSRVTSPSGHTQPWNPVSLNFVFPISTQPGSYGKCPHLQEHHETVCSFIVMEFEFT